MARCGPVAMVVENVRMCERSGTAARAGRPRNPSIEERVLRAAREELAEIGTEGFSMRRVARRARVARPSMALRWPDADALIVDALDDIGEIPEPEPTGSLRGDLIALLDALSDTFASPLIELQMRLVADARRHPELLARFQDRVMKTGAARFQRALTQAVERGDLPSDADRELLADALIGVLLVRTMASPRRRPPGAQARRALVDRVLMNFARQDQSPSRAP